MEVWMSLRTFVSIASLMCLVAFHTAFGQISQASLHGTVKDSTGAVVPGATVTLTSSTTTATRTATAGADGQYVISNIDPGNYKIGATFQGFKAFTISNLTLSTGQSAT